MSKVALEGNVNGTGTFTIASPNSNTDRTLNLPDASGTVQVSGNPISGTTASFSGDVTLGSSVLATPTGSAPSYTCRAWVNFNGTGTVAIRASGNVSSITDNGVGDYTVNFTTAMPDANYVTSGTVGDSASAATAPALSLNVYFGTTGQTASSVRVVQGVSTGAANDRVLMNVAIFR